MHSEHRNRGNVIVGAIILILLGASNILLIAKFLRLRTELNTAYSMIAKLQQDTDLVANVELYQKDTMPYEMRVYNHHNLSSAINSTVDITKNAQSVLLSHLTLSDLRARLISRGFLPGREYTLLVFFSPTDCPACLQEATQWQKLHLEGQGLNLSIVGIMNHPSISEGETYIKRFKVTFPILFDNRGLLRAHYKIIETPEKLLADSTGAILLRDHSNRTQERQIAFEQAVRKTLKEHKSTP